MAEWRTVVVCMLVVVLVFHAADLGTMQQVPVTPGIGGSGNLTLTPTIGGNGSGIVGVSPAIGGSGSGNVGVSPVIGASGGGNVGLISLGEGGSK